MVNKAKAQEFLAACFASGAVTQRGAEAFTRRWSDKAMHEEWSRLSGNSMVSKIKKPAGSIPLKQAICEICEATKSSRDSVYYHWRAGHLPLVVMRELMTRVDVDPASVSAAIQRMAEIKGGSVRQRDERGRFEA